MTEQETARLVNAIVSTWTTGPKGYIWTPVIAPLDYGYANATIERLRDTTPTITVYDFRQAYANNLGASTTRRHTATPDCPDCDGTGWVDDLDAGLTHTTNGETHTYTAVGPCHCTKEH